MTGSVGVGELYPFRGKAVDVRCLVEGTSKTAHIGPTQIINEEKNDIRRSVGGVIFGLAIAAEAKNTKENLKRN